MTINPQTVATDLSIRIAPDRVHRAGSQPFDECTRVWNGAISQRPDVVVQPASEADVQAVVRYARDIRLPITVRGGGHDWAGRSLTAGGVVIDMSSMRGVDVDVATSTARLAGGARAADVAAAAEPAGLAPATGAIGDVGMVGLTLSGGYGWLNGIAGLALDNLIEAKVVLADGSAVTANAELEPDLFWAIRGGGGNFGVVTEMRIKLHPVPLCTAGVIGFGWQEAAEVLRGFNELTPTMPDELTVPISAATGPDGGPALFLWPAWPGAPEASADWRAKLAGLGQPFVTHVAPMPYPAVLELIAPYIVWGRHYEMRTRNLPAFTDEAIAALVRAGDNRTTEFSGFSIHHFHGAATRVPLEQSAFGVREPHFMVEILAGWEPGTDGAAARDWAAAVYDDLAVHALDGGYPSLIGPEQAKQADAAYGPNAHRLRALKQRYDSAGIFSATTLPGTGAR
jgi:FAD/FMN-containing dehydrogenase